ncbi:MAG: DUF6063 family protein [Coprococcus sp.]
MDSRNLDKAIEIYSKLISGEEINRRHPDNGPLYEEFYGNAEVYDIVTSIMKKLNLSLYEYNDSLYITAGEGNRVFGYTNDDMKKLMGLRLNKELYLCYFIMYMILLYFYKDSETYQFREYVRTETVIEETGRYLAGLIKDLDVLVTEEIEQDSFKAIALLWDELPAVTNANDGENTRASKASRAGYVKLTFNFLTAQKLFIENSDRYYPTDRFKALAENYFEEYRGRLYQLLGGEEDA